LQNEDGFLPTVAEEWAALQRYNAYLNESSQSRMPLQDHWEELGPSYYNATTSWNPGVGRVTGLAVEIGNEDHILLGANTGGVWNTFNGGQTWTPLSDFFNNLKVYSVAIHPTNPSVYYFGSSGGNIFSSTDAGATWNLLGNLSSGNSAVNKILIHPQDPSVIYATASSAGIFRSVDGGFTWSRVAVTDFEGYDVEFMPGNPSVVFALGSKVHKSIDGGITFTEITGFNSGPKMMGVSASNPSIVYVLEAASGRFGGFYKSVDGGDTFTEIFQGGLNYFGYSTTGNDNSGQAPRDMDIAVHPNDPDEVHIAGILTWRSVDGGTSFTCTSDWIPNDAAAANIGYCHADVDILEFYGTTLYAGTDGGIFKVENTKNIDANYYTDITTGIGIRQFYKIGVSQTPQVVVTGGSQDNGTSFYTLDNGWIDWLGADGMEGFVDKIDPNIMYGTSQFGQLYRTDNAANTIDYLSEPGSGSGNWVTPFEQDPVVPNTIYLGYDQVFKSTNKGVAWTSISQGFGGNLEDLKVAASNPSILYAANGSQLYRTEDGGATNWQLTSAPSGLINNIAIHPTNPNLLAVATTSANRVMVSEDGGQTWESYKKNLPNFSALALVWDDNGKNGLYLGMNYGIYYIDSNLQEWQPYNTNLPNVQINELEINNVENKLYAGTYGRGLWVSPLVEDGVLATQTTAWAEAIAIAPNPVGDLLTVTAPFHLEADMYIFDVQGKLLAYHSNLTVNGSVSVPVDQLMAGVYFLRMATPRGSLTKKFVKK
jgi:photosystem II stability/assembly factor-like uncharacterized protein